MAVTEREHRAAQTTTGFQNSFVPAAESSGVTIKESASPPPNDLADISPTSLLLTANLRV
jgi:hypothetical protein